MQTPRPLANIPAPAAPPARKIDLIVIHCSATESGKPLQRGTPGLPGYQNAAQIIDGWHAERGFLRDPAACAQLNFDLPHIGYHYVVDLDGTVYTGRGLDEVGAHVKGYNAHSVGICLVGGVEPTGGRYTDAQWKSLKNLVLTLQFQLGVMPVSPRRNGDQMVNGVCGHRDLSPDANRDGVITPNEWLKTCPGFSVAAWLAQSLVPPSPNIYRS